MEKRNDEINNDLIERCKYADSKAQNVIYQMYARAMFHVAMRILNHSQWAEDAVQEAFISAFKKIKSYKGESSFGSWLKRIVVRKSIDECRKRNNQLYEDISKSVKEIPDEEILLDVEESAEMIKKIRKAMLCLPEGYRIVLNLNLFEGYDHQEISEILKIKESASRSQLCRAKQKLKEQITKNNLSSENRN